MKLVKTINPRNVSDEESSSYSVRTAARAVVLDKNNFIALLHVGRDGYYKLPGGGVEEHEDLIKALKRECLEEIGCDIEILDEIGFTTEYWKEDGEVQTSYCYFAKVLGEKHPPNFTENEKDRNFNIVWMAYDKAINLLEECKPTHFEGEYIVPRDLAFLKIAGENLIAE